MKRFLNGFLGGLLLFAILAASFATTTTVAAVGTKQVSAPTPLAPSGIITDTTPAYKWTIVPSTAAYQLQVFRGTTKVIDTMVAASTCGATTCSYTSAVVLTFSAHKWRVRGTNGYGVWTPWSAYKSFTVTGVPVSFNSQFNGSMAGWANRGTIPWLVNSKEMYTTSQANKCTNVYWKHSQAYRSFDYSARVKRPAGTPDYNLIYLAVRMGNVMFTDYNCWAPGYLFGYLDSGYLAIWRSDPDGKFIQLYDSVYTSMIKKNDWNVIRVVANGAVFKFYINGKLLATVNDNTYKKGWVGIRTFTDGSIPSQFLVDWAKLTVLP